MDCEFMDCRQPDGIQREVNRSAGVKSGKAVKRGEW